MTDNDNPVPKCPRCGTTVTTDAPDGLCPRCLIALNFVTETEIPGEEGPTGTQVLRPRLTPAPSPEDLAPHFPQLEILEVLGQGGMGAVYKARQPKLDRFVALKLLLRRLEDRKGDISFTERFAREARALARWMSRQAERRRTSRRSPASLRLRSTARSHRRWHSS